MNKDFNKDFIGKARAFADKAMEVAGEQIDKGKEFIAEKAEPIKIKLDIARVEAELEALYAGFGKACYNDIQGNHSVIKSAIKERLAELSELDDKLKVTEKKPTTYCTGCGAESDDDDMFCSKCGKKLKK